MATTGISKPATSFTITPHKLSICILVQVYAPPPQISIPFPFSSVSQHNCLGIFLLSLTKACESIFEPTLDELTVQLKEIGGVLNHWLSDQLTRRLSSLASPDDLFNFFNDMRGILGGCDSNVMDDDQIMLDPNSIIGMFVRRCLLSFNQMSFEGVCHLLTNVGTYCKEVLSGYPPYELSRLDDSVNYPNTAQVGDDFEGNKMGTGTIPFHEHVPNAFSEFVGDSNFSSRGLENSEVAMEASHTASSSGNTARGIGSRSGSFLRTIWQVQGYLYEQSDVIEKQGSSFPLNAFESLLKKLQKSASELHRVHYLRYLNNFYHDDYPGALENLHRYFDYRDRGS